MGSSTETSKQLIKHSNRLESFKVGTIFDLSNNMKENRCPFVSDVGLFSLVITKRKKMSRGIGKCADKAVLEGAQ